MLALQKSAPGPGLDAVRTPLPEFGPDDVLIRVRQTAICGTDLHIWRWDDWAAATVPTPMIVGHEFAGEIVALGERVSRPLAIGARVSGEGHVVDPHSQASREGRYHLDPNTRGVGVDRPGAFAEYLAIPAFNVVPLPDDLPLEIGALLDPFGNAMHTAQQFDLLGTDVLVTGAGPIGAMAAAIARRAGARTVVLTDVNPARLEIAARLADIRPVDISRESLRDVMAELGVETGFTVAMEMSGATQAIDQAVDALAMGGGLALLGLPAVPHEVLWSRIILKALTVKGVYGREMFGTWRRMLGLLRGGLDLRPLITHRYTAGRYSEAFAAALSGQAGKVLMSW